MPSLNAASINGPNPYTGNYPTPNVFDATMTVDEVLGPTVTRTSVGAERRYQLPAGTYVVTFTGEWDNGGGSVCVKCLGTILKNGAAYSATSGYQIDPPPIAGAFLRASFTCVSLIQLTTSDYLRFEVDVTSSNGSADGVFTDVIFQRV